MLISGGRRTWLQVGRLSVLGMLTVSGMLTMGRQDLTVIYGIVGGVAVVSAALAKTVTGRFPLSRKPYWFLMVLDAMLLGTFIYASGGVDGPFMPFLLVHALVYGFYLGISGGLWAAGVGIAVTAVISFLALNTPGSNTTLSPLLFILVQSGQMKTSASYIAMRILVNGLLTMAAGTASGILAQSLYTENGKLQRVLDNMADLRARSRQILDSLHDGVVVVGPGGDTLSVNPAATDLLGTDKPIENSPLGKMVRDFQANGDFPPVMDVVVGERIVECRFSEYGEDGGAIVVLTDTTDVRNYQAALEERDKLSLIGRLSATMAHEIRNPLASMSGAAQMLATGQLSAEKAERMAALVDKQAKRVSELIEGYLSLSRSSKDFPFTRFDVNELLGESIESALHGFAGGVSIKFKPFPSELFVMANRVRLGQAVWNLLRNAVEALENTSEPQVIVSTGRSAEDGSAVMKIADNGPGITDSFRNRIWEPFQSTKETGTGLGLYIVRRVVEEHNGTIGAENAPEGGAVFTIKLPGAGDGNG